MAIAEIPKKLKRDAIVEALLEVRFESAAVPEVFYGRIADHPAWGKFGQRRLPTADIPTVIRDADANLRFQPVFELVEVGGNRVVKIGPRVISLHILAPYLGWTKFKPQLDEMIELLFSKASPLTVKRLGMRYLNALTKQDHGITQVGDLDLRITVAESNLGKALNLNFTREMQDNILCTVRIATPDFISGPVPSGASTLIDVDVYTPDRFTTSESGAAKQWVAEAHEIEKAAFFQLLTKETIEQLREE